MREGHRLGELQLAIMRTLWTAGEATVADVHHTLQRERGLALTTIATMLRKMEQKGVVTHRVDGRQFVYRATVDERDVHRSMVGDLVRRLFDGDATALVSHLVREGEIDRGELDELRKRIDRRRRGAKEEADA
jgi:predicted transcriptional regulator